MKKRILLFFILLIMSMEVTMATGKNNNLVRSDTPAWLKGGGGGGGKGNDQLRNAAPFKGNNQVRRTPALTGKKQKNQVQGQGLEGDQIQNQPQDGFDGANLGGGATQQPNWLQLLFANSKNNDMLTQRPPKAFDMLAQRNPKPYDMLSNHPANAAGYGGGYGGFGTQYGWGGGGGGGYGGGYGGADPAWINYLMGLYSWNIR